MACKYGGRNWGALRQTPRKNELTQDPVPDVENLGGRTCPNTSRPPCEKLPVFCGIEVVGNTLNEASSLWDVRVEDVKTREQASEKSKNLVLLAAHIAPEAYLHRRPRWPEGLCRHGG